MSATLSPVRNEIVLANYRAYQSEKKSKYQLQRKRSARIVSRALSSIELNDDLFPRKKHVFQTRVGIKLESKPPFPIDVNLHKQVPAAPPTIDRDL